MSKMLGFFKLQNETTAEISGAALVVSMLDAETPRVWRADLARLSQAVFEARPAPAGGFMLTLITNAGAAEDLAHYAGRDAAIAALSAVTAALRSLPASASPATGLFARVLKFILKIGGWLFLAFLLLLVLRILFGTPQVPPMATQGSAVVKPGVPQSAEELFGQ